MPLLRAVERARARFGLTRGNVRPQMDTWRDPLTGLLTSAGLLITAAREPYRPGAIVLFDLDHFRAINTVLDIAGGDRVLIEVARRIAAISPPDAIVARTGIDEFAVVLAATGELDANAFAGRIARAVEQPITVSGEPLSLTVSLGVAEPRASEPLDATLRRAGSALRPHRDPEWSRDERVRRAMSTGGLMRRFTLERTLRDALANGRLQLMYQPIVNLETHVAEEFEALIRWDHEECGMLLPGQFLFDIESDDLLRDIGRWVLREACRQGRTWQDQRPDRPLMMAVNLSSSQIRDSQFLGDVSTALEETGFDASLLRLEISESITLDEIDAAVPLVRGLRELGVGLALDDFGAGNSGWTLLRQSQIDVIKLDQSFIAVSERDLPENIRMVEALSGFANRLGMAVSIEGVERADQAAAMRNVGVQQAQGYYFGCPQPAINVAPWLAEIPLRPIA